MNAAPIEPRKVLSILFVVTVSLLIHVHTQVSIFRTSYSIQKKEKELSRLSDELRVMQYEVSKLHSLGYLDRKKTEMNVKLVPPRSVKVISVPVVKEIPNALEPPAVVRKGFFSFVNLVKEAQAKTSR